MAKWPNDKRLAEWARRIESLSWSGLVIDREFRLIYVSRELRDFLDNPSDDEVGIGRHIIEAFAQDAWLRVVSPESQLEVFMQIAPYAIGDLERRGKDARAILPEQFLPLLDQVVRCEIPEVDSFSFDYMDPRAELDLPSYRVDSLLIKLEDDDGLAGGVIISFMGVRPNLITLLARGNQEMYERMAHLIEPGPRQAAILFCDLRGSGRVSRQMPSASYFRLIRRLWRNIDTVVAEEKGIVGKHAGDGASAFFLVDDLGSNSAAAAAAVRAARRIHELSGDIFSEVVGSACLMKIGLHWGGALYMGQLVPGGRLDVTALGDEVNETARIEECADAGQTLASKQLLEQLTQDAAAEVGIDIDKLSYQTLAERADLPEKTIRDLGSIAVTPL